MGVLIFQTIFSSLIIKQNEYGWMWTFETTLP